MTETAPLVDPALIDRLIDTGQPFDLEARRGGLEETTGSATGPSVYQSGGETATEYDFGNPTVNPLTGETSAGGATGTADAMAFFDGVTGLHWGLFGIGVALILAALVALRFGRKQTALYAGLGGAAFLASAFYTWLIYLALAAMVALAVRTYLSDIKRAKEQAERAKEQKVLGSVIASVESDPAAKTAVKAGMKQRGMAAPEFRAVVDEAKRREGMP